MSERQIIWEADLDNGKYKVVVERIDENHGQLIVNQADNQTEIMSEKVPLAYGAAYGPDYSDILSWQEMIVAKIPES